jgi:hypothetical protein
MTVAGRNRQAAALPAEPTIRETAPAARPARRMGARNIVKPPQPDPMELERERLLHRVLAAEGRPTVTRAADEFLKAGFDLPRQQEVWLQLLEHQDESRVVEAIDKLAGILEEEEPQRRNVLESRLRRIAEYADEPRTQKAATELRRVLSTRRPEVKLD